MRKRTNYKEWGAVDEFTRTKRITCTLKSIYNTIQIRVMPSSSGKSRTPVKSESPSPIMSDGTKSNQAMLAAQGHFYRQRFCSLILSGKKLNKLAVYQFKNEGENSGKPGG